MKTLFSRSDQGCVGVLQVFFNKCYQANHVEFPKEADCADTLANSLVVSEFIVTATLLIVYVTLLNCVLNKIKIFKLIKNNI